MGDADASISVLICDDVEPIRRLLTLIVESRPGLRVVGEAGTGTEAIAQAGDLQPDVVMLDLSMPGVSGFDALPDIRAAAPSAKVIVFSGFSAAVMAEDVLAQGADRYIEKGAAPNVIADAIEQAGTQARQARRAGT